MRVLAIAALVAFAGCAAPAADTDPLASQPAPASSVLFEAAACTAHNAFLQTTQDALRPHVPSNWTFTGAREPHAILRMLHVTCDDLGLLVLSTPMFPDEASLDKHENPDVVIDVFTTDLDAIERWSALGIPAKLAEFTTAPFVPGGESRIVTVEGALVLGLDVLPEAPRPRGSYEWRAVYATGTHAISWFWGDEVADESAFMTYGVHLGPATRVDGADVHPAGSGSFWPSIDLRYLPGLPPQAE